MPDPQQPAVPPAPQYRSSMMYVYSPPSDNNPTDSYIAFIADWLSKALPIKVTADTTLGEIWHS